MTNLAMGLAVTISGAVTGAIGETLSGVEEFALTNGKTTLEMTPGGKYPDGLRLFEKGSPLIQEEARNVWTRLSARYAQNASGNTYWFVKDSWKGSIFNTVEYPERLIKEGVGI